jgi:predicted transcriptional regulator
LRERAAALIIKRLESLTITQAANDLKVSRQAIYGFKNGTFCPSLAVIQRACEAWKLEFEVRGMKISEDSFKPPPALQTIPPQLSFYDIWEQLLDQRMTVVRAERVNGAVEMTLRIAIPA